MRELSLTQCKALAADWDGQTAAEYQDALRTKCQDTHFQDCTASQLVQMWETGRGMGGRKLNDFEFGALCIAWIETFNSYPPSVAEGSVEPDKRSAPAEPLPDAMINMREVTRLTGLSESTIKRRVAEGLFPPAIKLSERRNGWRMSTVLEWINERPTA